MGPRQPAARAGRGGPTGRAAVRRQRVATYRWVDHTAELELEIAACTEAAVFADALAAFAELLGEAPAAPAAAHAVRLEGDDRAVLLADWIGELEFLAETTGLYPREAELTVGPARVEGTVYGTTGDPPHVVKAVTYHRLALERRKGGWHATVVLDV